MAGTHVQRSAWWRIRTTLTALGVVAMLAPAALAGGNPTFTLTTVSPSAAAVGTSITISGSNLSAVNSVVFPNGAATFPTLTSASSVTVAVPADASGAGPLSVSNGKKTLATSSFSVTPTISSISPTSGAAFSTVITITGTGLAALTGIDFTGTAAVDFGVNSNQSAWATAPNLSSKSNSRSTLTVTTPGGTATSAQSFSQTSIGSSAAVFTAGEVVQGQYHACARKSDGTVWCWGANFHGELGNGRSENSIHPVQVLASGYEGGTGSDAPVPLTGARQLAAGAASSCALLTDGTVWCWGFNYAGQLGIGASDDDPHPNPVQVLASGSEGASPDPLTDIVSIGAGLTHVCGVKSDGTAVCWGSNSYGQLGNGAAGGSEENPVAVVAVGGGPSLLSGVVAVTGGERHTCALLASGQATCWGTGTYGELGDGTFVPYSTTPVRVLATPGGAPIGGITQIVAFSAGACVRRSTGSGSVWCWGYDGNGALGSGAFGNSSVPVQVVDDAGAPLSLVTDLAAATLSVCAARSDGSAWCWGANWDGGPLGDGTRTSRNVAAPVLASGTPSSNPVPLTGVIGVESGSSYSNTMCAILSGGGSNIRCWGKANDGQTGDGVLDTSDRLNPVPVRPRPYLEARSVATGYNHSCAVRTDGAVLCWGDNETGQLGDGTSGFDANRTRPVFVLLTGSDQFSGPRLGGAVGVAATWGSTCALLSGGTVWCWGDGAYGELGQGAFTSSLSPVRVRVSAGVPLTGVTAITATGDAAFCALRSDGSVWCWGENGRGSLGDGSTVDRSQATRVAGIGGTGSLSGVTAISAGYGQTCAIRKNGGSALVCWGRNDSGQVGDGTTTDRLYPVAVRGVGGSGTLTGVTSVSAIEQQTCAVLKGGAAVCWGDNGYGQLGDGTMDPSSVPVAVHGLGDSGTLTGVTSLSGGQGFTCARLGDGRIACWGDNGDGQLGDGSTLIGRSYPELVLAAGSLSGGDDIGFSGASSLGRGGGLHLCALVGTRVFCWGNNARGQIGDGGIADVLHPFATFGTYDPWS